MNLTDRDRKIVLVIVPVVLIAAYWLLLLAPKRDEAGKLGERLTQAEQKRDDAEALSAQLEGAKATYAKDYATVVRLGKAIPSTLDMPSLIVQLDQAAKGTGIRFRKVRAGARNEAPTPPAPGGESGKSGDKSTPASAAGGEKAGTGLGKATEHANEAKQTSDQRSGAAGAGGAGDSTSGAPGLDNVPLEFSFGGSFFDLADFFHRMKRFVRVANERIQVEGRLMTIDGLTFESGAFPTLKAEVRATVYLSPKDEGTTAGATSKGPASTPAAAPSTAPAPASSPVAQAGELAR